MAARNGYLVEIGAPVHLDMPEGSISLDRHLDMPEGHASLSPGRRPWVEDVAPPKLFFPFEPQANGVAHWGTRPERMAERRPMDLLDPAERSVLQ